jgi:EmrB/QacA subfamily drug resistance transporter
MARTEAQRRRLTLIATILGSSLAFLDVTVVIVALPTIEKDLNLGLAGEQWVYLSYSLALASLYLVAGAVGDRRGRREVFTVGVAVFAAASLLAAVAPNGGVLIAARTLQGIGGAFVTTNSLALLRQAYGKDAGRAIGLWTSFTGVVTIAGPPVGGALVEWASWRWIFLINLPVAVATVWFARAGECRRQEATGGTQRLDVPGAALIAVGIGTLTYALVEGARHGFADYWWLIGVAAAALIAFLVVEHRKESPMLPLELFRIRNFAASNAATFLVYAAIGAWLVYVALYIQFLGYSPFVTSVILAPTTVLMILLAPKFGALADRNGPRLYLTIGPGLLGCSALLLAAVDTKAKVWYLALPALAIFSLGLAILVAPITATALKSVPEKYAGIASGINTTFSRIGNLLAVAIVGLVVTIVFQSNGGTSSGTPLAKNQTDAALHAASIDAWRAAMAVVAALAFAGAAVGAIFVSNREARGEEEVEEEAATPGVAAAET